MAISETEKTSRQSQVETRNGNERSLPRLKKLRRNQRWIGGTLFLEISGASDQPDVVHGLQRDGVRAIGRRRRRRRRRRRIPAVGLRDGPHQDEPAQSAVERHRAPAQPRRRPGETAFTFGPTLTAPSPPLEIGWVTLLGAQVNWNAPVKSNGIVLLYRVHVSPPTPPTQVVARTTELMLGHLFAPGVNYTFHVTAENANYASQPSAAASLLFDGAAVIDAVTRVSRFEGFFQRKFLYACY